MASQMTKPCRSPAQFMGSISELTELRTLSSNCSFCTSQLAPLSKLPHLECLAINGLFRSDEGLVLFPESLPSVLNLCGSSARDVEKDSCGLTGQHWGSETDYDMPATALAMFPNLQR